MVRLVSGSMKQPQPPQSLMRGSKGRGVLPKGVAIVRRRGRTYVYAWRGGPRIDAEPGTDAFLVELAEARRAITGGPPENTVAGLIASYLGSQDYQRLAVSTKAAWRPYLDSLSCHELGSMPLTATEDLRCRAEFQHWREGFLASPRGADMAWTAIKRVFNFGIESGRVRHNPCQGGKRFYQNDRSDVIWTDQELAGLLRFLGPAAARVVTLMAYTGLARGDAIKLPWSAYDGTTIQTRRAKTGVRVAVPVHPDLRKMLDATPRNAPTMCLNSHGKPYTATGLSTEFHKARAKAGIEGKRLHDLRGTAATKFMQGGFSEAQIAAFLGWKESQLRQMRAVYIDAASVAMQVAKGWR